MRRAFELGARFDGWDECFDYATWMRAADEVGVDVAWYTRRERGEDEVFGWDHLDSGLERDWLWTDWRDAVDAGSELEDCRWTPCYDCGVCPGLDLQHQTGTYRSSVRVRVRYAKTGRIRFISALDVGRLWERALRRADLPIAYSEGFSPHPKVSFPDALPLGYASTGEYAELTFAGPHRRRRGLRGAQRRVPEGGVRHAVAVADGEPKLASLLRASCWDVAYPAGTVLDAAVAAVSAAERLPVARARKGDPVEVDLRPAIAQISCCDARACALTLHHAEHLPRDVAAVAVRPTEVDLALRQTDPDLPEPVLVTRVAQGRPAPQGLYEALSGELIEPPQPTVQRHRP